MTRIEVPVGICPTCRKLAPVKLLEEENLRWVVDNHNLRTVSCQGGGRFPTSKVIHWIWITLPEVVDNNHLYFTCIPDKDIPREKNNK